MSQLFYVWEAMLKENDKVSFYGQFILSFDFVLDSEIVRKINSV